MKKTLIMCLMVFALFVSVAPALAYETDDAAVVADALLVRPVGLVAIAAGSVVFVVALPFSLPTGSANIVAKKLILDPVEFTFVRPVGNFDYKMGTWKTGWSKEEE